MFFMSTAKHMNNAPFFIVGSGRSGSTLLRVMLACHSRLCIPPETWFLLPLVEKFPLTDILSNAQVAEIMNIVTTHYRWPDLNLDQAVILAKVNSLTSPTLSSICNVIYSTLTDIAEKPRWGDKTPPYIKVLPQIIELYPNAQFLHLVRDGHDVTKSFQVKGWYGHSLHSNTIEWKTAIQCARRYSDKFAKSQLITVRYENLVQHTETELRRICDFLGEEFETEMLERQPHLEELIPERERHIHQKITRKPTENDVYRWKRELSAGDNLIIEAYLYNELDQAGYERMYKSSIWVPVFALTRLLCGSTTIAIEGLVSLKGFLAGNIRSKKIDKLP